MNFKNIDERRITGIVLAGGKSSRMGTDKGMLEIEEVPSPVFHCQRSLLNQAGELVRLALTALEDLKQLDESLYERYLQTRQAPENAEAAERRMRRLWDDTFRGLRELLQYVTPLLAEQARKPTPAGAASRRPLTRRRRARCSCRSTSSAPTRRRRRSIPASPIRAAGARSSAWWRF